MATHKQDPLPTVPMGRREAGKAAKRARILDAAERRLRTQGYDQMTMAEVAEALSRGVAVAEDICGRGLALSAALFLQGQARMVGQAALSFIPDRSLCDA